MRGRLATMLTGVSHYLGADGEIASPATGERRNAARMP
jgi:hypothetical protein